MSKLKKIQSLTIYRKLWSRGAGQNVLLDEGGMCCLGFACHATGVPMEDLYDRRTPEILDRVVPLFTSIQGDTRFTDAAVHINDRALDKGRESDLRTLFKKKGIELRFSNATPSLLKRDFKAVIDLHSDD